MSNNYDFKQAELLELPNKIEASFAIEQSENGEISVLSTEGIYVFSIKGDMSSEFSNVSMTKSYFTLNRTFPVDLLELDISTFSTELPKFALYEATFQTELSPNLNYATSFEPAPLTAKWAPGTHSILAVGSNVFGLELYQKCINQNDSIEFISACNVSERIVAIDKPTWKDATRMGAEQKLKELKRRSLSVFTRSFCWTNIFRINKKKFCTLIVGHFDGSLTFWRINLDNIKDKIDLQFLTRYNCNCQEITSLFHHSATSTSGGIAFGTLEGQIGIVKVSWPEAKCSENSLLWEEKDKMQIEYLTFLLYNKTIFLLAVKQYYLIIYCIDDSGRIVDQKAFNASNFHISGIWHKGNEIVIQTLTGPLKLLTVNKDQNQIVLEQKTIELNLNPTYYRFHGFAISRNKALMALLAYPCQLKDLKNVEQKVSMIWFYNPGELFKTIWNNEGDLREVADCFEALRLKCIKDKAFPWIGIDPDLNYDELSIKKLKALRLIARFSEKIFSRITVIEKYEIKPYILIHYVLQMRLVLDRLNLLLGKEKLSRFEMRSIDIQAFFLKEMIASDVPAKANLGERYVQELSSVLRACNELEYPDMPYCFWCGEKILGPSCIPPHGDSRCSVSMMPIMVPGFKCPLCKALVHDEVEKELETLTCQYCDFPLYKKVVPKQESSPPEGPFCTREDCEGFEEDIEDCAVDELTLFSDSEAEDDCNHFAELFSVNKDADSDNT